MQCELNANAIVVSVHITSKNFYRGLHTTMLPRIVVVVDVSRSVVAARLPVLKTKHAHRHAPLPSTSFANLANTSTSSFVFILYSPWLLSVLVFAFASLKSWPQSRPRFAITSLVGKSTPVLQTKRFTSGRFPSHYETKTEQTRACPLGLPSAHRPNRLVLVLVSRAVGRQAGGFCAENDPNYILSV